MDVDGLMPLPPPEDASMEQPDAPSGSALVSPPSGLLPCTPAEERRLVMEKEQADQIEAGRSYCLLERKWHVEWLQWVGDDRVRSPKHGPATDPSDLGRSPTSGVRRGRSWTKDRPGPIDNSELLDVSERTKLKPALSEHEHYELVSEEVWSLLHSWYAGGPAVKRRAIQQPSGSVVVELYGISLHIYRSSDTSVVQQTMTESKMTSVRDFKNRACEELGLQADRVRVWDYFNRKKYANLEDSLLKNLDNCRIYDGNDILLEEQNADGTWPPEEQTRSSTIGGSYWSSSRQDASEDVPTTGTPLVKGASGLQNLGNTCFMNSSLQCLSSVTELRDYFVADTYRPDLNEGAYKTKGKLAESFSKLLNHIWNPSTVQVAPRNFKWQIGQFAEQFAGYGQQDSMEFIEYLLDGLKEDVNRVHGAKPFVELKEADGRPDAVVAEEARDGHIKRNNSFIDELFLGWFKSTVTCPEPGCGRVSIKFDPFSSVKLSLVSNAEDRCANFEVTVVLLESPRVPVQRHTVSIPKFGNALDLLEATAQKVDREARYLMLVEIYAKKIYKFFETNDAVESIGSNDTLVAYELAEWTGADEKCEVVIHNRQAKASQSSSSYYRAELLGIPFPTYVRRNISGHDLIEAVKAELAKRIGPSLDGKWRLFRTAEKFNIADCREEVVDDADLLDLGSRHFLVVDLSEDAELPEAITTMLEDCINERTTGYGRNAGGRGQASADLSRCFQMFTETDKLSPMDTWYCSKCKEHREAYKKMEFWSLPPVLILHLKRFTYTTYSRDRLDTAVAFPLEGLDLSSFVLGPGGENCLYDCCSVSKHMGGLGGGHYVAYGRSSENGKWYLFNDSSVSEVTAAEVAADQVGAYVLFYIRRDRRPACW